MKKKRFTPSTIEKARIAAGFKCCVCQIRPCFETHHLDQKKDNDFDTAAPLCKFCHDSYGPDSQKQKFIRQARDYWYKYNEETRSIRTKEIELNKEILEKLEALEEKTATKDEILEDLVPKVVATLSSIESDVNNYAKEGDYSKYIQSLCSLGSTATYSSGQISTVKAHDITKEKQEKEPMPTISYPASMSIWPLRCTDCGLPIYDQRFSIGSICPYCGGVLQ